MKQSQNWLKKPVFSSALLGGLLLISFQNCSQNGFETEDALLAGESAGGLDSANTSKYGTDVASKLAAMPIAYRVGFDYVSYNSCSGADLAQRPNAFSFKFGAFESGGLALSTQARDYLNDTSNFRPVAPATQLSLAQKKAYIYDSQINRDLALQLAWRTKGQPGWLRNNSPVVNKDYKDVTMNLSDDRILDPIAKNDVSWSRHFPFAPDVRQRRLESTFFYNETSAVAEFLRNDLEFGASADGSQGMLAFAFRKTDQDPKVPMMLNDNVDGSSAYGVGFTFSFVTQPEAVANGITNNPRNILAGINELDLATGNSTGSTWSCPSTLRLKIVRKDDAATVCPADPPASLSDPAYRAQLRKIRNILPASDWDVSVLYACAVPKNYECYPREVRSGTVIPVEYNATRECFQAHKPSSHYINPGAALNYCTQYVTICQRSN